MSVLNIIFNIYYWFKFVFKKIDFAQMKLILVKNDRFLQYDESKFNFQLEKYSPSKNWKEKKILIFNVWHT